MEKAGLTETMRALVLVSPRSLEVRQEPMAVAGPEELILEVGVAGVCGSELGGFLGTNALRTPPLIMGHEAAGRVFGGEGLVMADGSLSKAGLQVTFNPLITCGTCDFCTTDRSSLCPDRKLIGAHRPGAFARYVAVPSKLCWPLSEGTSLVTGSLAEPVSCAVRAVGIGGPDEDELLWIIGAGPIGLCCLAVARHAGVRRVVVSDISPKRLKVAQEWGAVAVLNASDADSAEFFRHEMGEAPGTVIDAVGAESTRGQAIKTVSPGGTVVLVGLHLEESMMPANQIVRNEIVLRGSFGYTQSDFRNGLALLEKGIVAAGDEWIQVRPLEEGQHVFEELVEQRSERTKVVLSLT